MLFIKFVYFSFAVISLLIGSTALALTTTNATRVFHSKLVKRILLVPMSFFDTTPLGRIMNRCVMGCARVVL